VKSRRRPAWLTHRDAAGGSRCSAARRRWRAPAPAAARSAAVPTRCRPRGRGARSAGWRTSRCQRGANRTPATRLWCSLGGLAGAACRRRRLPAVAHSSSRHAAEAAVHSPRRASTRTLRVRTSDTADLVWWRPPPVWRRDAGHDRADGAPASRGAGQRSTPSAAEEHRPPSGWWCRPAQRARHCRTPARPATRGVAPSGPRTPVNAARTLLPLLRSPDGTRHRYGRRAHSAAPRVQTAPARRRRPGWCPQAPDLPAESGAAPVLVRISTVRRCGYHRRIGALRDGGRRRSRILLQWGIVGRCAGIQVVPVLVGRTGQEGWQVSRREGAHRPSTPRTEGMLSPPVAGRRRRRDGRSTTAHAGRDTVAWRSPVESARRPVWRPCRCARTGQRRHRILACAQLRGADPASRPGPSRCLLAGQGPSQTARQTSGAASSVQRGCGGASRRGCGSCRASRRRGTRPDSRPASRHRRRRRHGSGDDRGPSVVLST
jgi:hypothetical protein